MFSKTCENALRAVIFIAQHSKNNNRVGIKAISKGIDTPQYFIAKILQDLSRKGFIQSAKGPHGGFYLEERHLDLSVADIVEEIDGTRLFSGCALGLQQCSSDHPCPIHEQFKNFKQNFKDMLEGFKIQAFVDNLNLRITHLKI